MIQYYHNFFSKNQIPNPFLPSFFFQQSSSSPTNSLLTRCQPPNRDRTGKDDCSAYFLNCSQSNCFTSYLLNILTKFVNKILKLYFMPSSLYFSLHLNKIVQNSFNYSFDNSDKSDST